MIDRAAIPAWRVCFEAILDADPSNQVVRRDLADHLEERGDCDAEPLRWLAKRNRYPHAPTEDELGWSWYWLPDDDPRHFQDGEADSQNRLTTNTIPESLWDRLRRVSNLLSTRFDAEQDFCAAYHEAKEMDWQPTPATTVEAMWRKAIAKVWTGEEG